MIAKSSTTNQWPVATVDTVVMLKWILLRGLIKSFAQNFIVCFLYKKREIVRDLAVLLNVLTHQIEQHRYRILLILVKQDFHWNRQFFKCISFAIASNNML